LKLFEVVKTELVYGVVLRELVYHYCTMAATAAIV
jgi:hypothetical protein